MTGAAGLRALEDPDIAAELGAERVLRARAFGKLVQGLAHAGLAIMYDQAFIVDETTAPTPASCRGCRTRAAATCGRC